VIATQSGSRELPGSGTGQDLADRIVREVLEAANADQSGQLWSSLSQVLPALAEASPLCFLDAVDAGLDSGGLRAVFDPEAESTPFASPTHTGLLWALEALAWSPDYLGGAAQALARLGQVDPGGRWANRPDRSLGQIFLPWHPRPLPPETTVWPSWTCCAATRCRLDAYEQPAPDSALGELLQLHVALARLAAWQ
jgi:hypothetical protein